MLGLLSLQEALRLAQEKNLDLIQVTEKAEPPVCRIMDLGKYLYREEKKAKPVRGGQGEIKGIRLRFGIAPHDLEIRVKQTEKFFQKGHLVKVDLILRGREKALSGFATEKINQFLKILETRVPVKIEKGLQRHPRGFTMIISKGTVKPVNQNYEKKTENQKIDNQAV